MKELVLALGQAHVLDQEQEQNEVQSNQSVLQVPSPPISQLPEMKGFIKYASEIQPYNSTVLTFICSPLSYVDVSCTKKSSIQSCPLLR